MFLKSSASRRVSNFCFRASLEETDDSLNAFEDDTVDQPVGQSVYLQQASTERIWEACSICINLPLLFGNSCSWNR